MGLPENSKYVNVTVPAILFGGNPKGLLKWMRIRGKPLVGHPGGWQVCTEESFLRRPRPELVRYQHLAGPGATNQIDKVLAKPVSGATFDAGPDAIERVNEIGARFETSSDIVDMFTHVKLAIMVSSEVQLPAVVNDVFHAIRNVRSRANRATVRWTRSAST